MNKHRNKHSNSASFDGEIADNLKRREVVLYKDNFKTIKRFNHFELFQQNDGSIDMLVGRALVEQELFNKDLIELDKKSVIQLLAGFEIILTHRDDYDFIMSVPKTQGDVIISRIEAEGGDNVVQICNEVGILKFSEMVN
jgi:hypothetical protein